MGVCKRGMLCSSSSRLGVDSSSAHVMFVSTAVDSTCAQVNPCAHQCPLLAALLIPFTGNCCSQLQTQAHCQVRSVLTGCVLCACVLPLLLPLLLQVSGAAMAYAFLGERWGPMGWAGAAVILAASLACQLGGAFDEDDGSAGGSKGKEDAAQEA